VEPWRPLLPEGLLRLIEEMCTQEDPSYVRRDRTRYARSAPDEERLAEHDAGYLAADAFKATPAYAALNPDLRDAYEGAAETEGRNALLELEPRDPAASRLGPARA